MNVTVKEREPALYVANSYNGYIMVDYKGTIMSVTNSIPDAKAPLLTGEKCGNAFVGDDVANERVDGILRFLMSINSEARRQIAELMMDNDKNVKLQLRNGLLLRLGRAESMPEKAPLFNTVFNEIKDKNIQAEYIDLQSFVDWWIVYELAQNWEPNNPKSCYMHKDINGKIKAGPVWDFDWGTLSFVENPDAKEHIFLKEAIWYVRLFRDPYFVTVLKERWNELYPALQTVPDYMDEKRGQIRKSADINFQLWDITVGKSRKIINGDELLTFDDAVDLLKANYLTHLETMNREINEL